MNKYLLLLLFLSVSSLKTTPLAPLYTPFPEEKTPLMIAAENGQLDVMTNLIASEADVNANEGMDQPRAGRTVLTYAIHSGSSNAVKLLLDAGASVEALADVPHEDNKLEPSVRNVPHISYAIMVGASINIVRLLISYCKNINEPDIWGLGWTRYKIAAFYNNQTALQALEEAGADTTI